MKEDMNLASYVCLMFGLIGWFIPDFDSEPFFAAAFIIIYIEKQTTKG